MHRQSDTVNDKFNADMKAINEKYYLEDYEAAIQSALAFIAKYSVDGKCEVGYRFLAAARQRAGQNKLALKDANQVLALSYGGCILSYVTRSRAHKELGNYQSAIEDASAAISKYSQFSQAFLARAEAKKALGDLKGAVADADKAIELTDADLIDKKYAHSDAYIYFLYRQRAKAHQFLAYTDKAKADERTAAELRLKISSETVSQKTNNNQEKEDSMQGRLTEAQINKKRIDDFNEIERLKKARDFQALISFITKVLPDYINKNEVLACFYVEMANAKIELKDFDGAMQAANSALFVKSDEVDAYAPRAVANYALGNYAQTILDADTVINERPNTIAPHLFKAKARLALDSKADTKHALLIAVMNATNSLARDNTNPQVYLIRAEANRLLDRRQAAETDEVAANALLAKCKPSASVASPLTVFGASDQERMIKDFQEQQAELARINAIPLKASPSL